MQAPTNPTAPIDDTEKSPNPISEAPPTYNSHYQPVRQNTGSSAVSNSGLVVDCMGQEIMRMQRPLRYTCCCFCCSSTMQELEVQSPPGVPLGYIMQQGVFFATNFRIENEKKEHVLNIDGPCKAQCCSDTIFQIRSMDGINIGSIRRQWPGAAEAEIADIDNYEITFPLDLNVTLKAMVFAATFLIDFMFFEHSPRDDRQHDNY
uniref:Phospholipid scramblase n=1 Tax=Phascolarctos cinereus TaxID=38626 RepID=A0A6P5JR41_PHACI|nr:phospholipid scramblase 4-like isoform X2 [Phascolarctos cinereus]